MAPAMPVSRGPFYLVMSVLIAVVIVAGFSRTIGDNLLHPVDPRPAILTFHAVAFATWVLLFITQAGLIQAGRRDIHRRLGAGIAVLGAVMVPLGLFTAVAMVRFHLAHGEPDAAAFFPIPVWDMTAFAVLLTLGILRRARPETHKRLMLMATIALTAAAWGRFPVLDQTDWFYAGVDALVVVAIGFDWIRTRTIHPVYRFGLPALIAGQCLASYLHSSPAWRAAAPGLFHVGPSPARHP